MAAGKISIDVSLPRMRGDPPLYVMGLFKLAKSTPHARGSTSVQLNDSEGVDVYPACAGIHPLLLPIPLPW